MECRMQLYILQAIYRYVAASDKTDKNKNRYKLLSYRVSFPFGSLSDKCQIFESVSLGKPDFWKNCTASLAPSISTCRGQMLIEKEEEKRRKKKGTKGYRELVLVGDVRMLGKSAVHEKSLLSGGASILLYSPTCNRVLQASLSNNCIYLRR